MSTTISAASQRYTVSGLSLSTTNFTLMGWIQRAVDRNAFTVPISLHDTSGGSYGVITTDAGGDLLYIEHNVSGGEDAAVAGPTLDNTSWFFVCFSRAGTGTNSGKFYYANGNAALSLAQVTITGTLTATALTIGDEATSGNFFNGKIAAVKVWSVGLTQAEVDSERWQFQPARTANLFAAYYFDEGGATANAQKDSSGNGRTLSGGTGSTTGVNPPDVTRLYAGSLGLLGCGR